MSLTFIHSADWQIGKPFRSFPPEMAGRLSEARLDAIDRLGTLARERSARFVLVAGDVYDTEGLPRRARLQPLSRMAAFGDVTWVLLPGNHDPVAAGGIWDRLDGHLPANVILAARPEPILFDNDVAVLPAPLRHRLTVEDLTVWMDGCQTPPDRFRIGLAHGSVQGFGSQNESNTPIAPDRATRARLDYLALGDWHGTVEVNARTWYAGTPEPDQFSDNANGHALVVTIDAPGAEPVVERVRTAQYTWVRMSEMLHDAAQFDALDARLGQAAQGAPQRLLVRLTVEGALTLDGLKDFRAWCDRHDASFAHFAVRQDGLRVRGDLANHPEIEANADLVHAVRHLQSLCEAAEGEGGKGAGQSEGGQVSARTARAALMALVDAVETAAGERT